MVFVFIKMYKHVGIRFTFKEEFLNNNNLSNKFELKNIYF